MRRAARNTKSVFREGFDARMSGKGPGDNPYPHPTLDWLEWRKGWNCADDLERKKGASS